MLLFELDELLAILLCGLLIVLLGVLAQKMPEFESIRISGNCRWLDWHGHWLTRLEHSPITERPHHVTDSTFFLEVKISFDVTFDFVEPPLQVSDSLVVRHISHIISRLRLLGVKVESIS